MKKKVRLVFLLVILIFVTGFYISRKIEEPYPALVFPAFAAIPNTSRPIKKSSIKIFFQNQDSSLVNPNDLFYHLPTYITNVILSRNFTRNNSFISTGKSRKRLNNVGPERRADEEKINNIEDDEQVAACVFWIKNRITQITNRSDLARLEVLWYHYSFDLKNNTVKDSLVEKFTVNLN